MEEEVGKSPFHLFAKNTKQTCMLMCISLFIIVIITVLNSNSIRSKLFLLAAVSLLSYCLYTNMKETSVLYHSQSLENDIDIKKNIVMSYVFSSVLILFIFYVLYTMIF
jgi:hypothetical protein